MAVDKSRTTEQRLQMLNEAVSMTLDLDGNDIRVFLYLSRQLNFDSPVHVPQLQVATMLGKRRPHISRSIRKLTEAGVLICGPDGTRASKYMMNPHFAE